MGRGGEGVGGGGGERSKYVPVRFTSLDIVSISVNLGPVVQSIVSSMSLLVVRMLTFLLSTISNSQVFLLKKCE